MSTMKQQIFVTHTIRQTEILALLDGWIRITPSVTMLCPQQLSWYMLKIQHA